MSTEFEIHGHCDPRFLPLKEMFTRNFERGLEVGASLAVSLDGEMVVDLWGGFANAKRTRPWEADTLMMVFSMTKFITSICGLMLVDQGKLDLDAPVAHYWPEFARHNKDKVLVRHVFTHRSGIPGFRPPIPHRTVLDWQGAVTALEEQRLWWEPGTKSGYQANTFGFLLGELIRRVSGRTPGVFLRDEVTSKIDADFHIGLPEGELARRCQMVLWENERDLGEEGSVAYEVMNSYLPPSWDNLDFLTSELPGENGMGNARSAAKVAAILATGGELAGHRFLSPETIDLMLAEQSYEYDVVFREPVRYGLGVGLNSKEFECPGDGSAHWGGAGGSVLIADATSRTTFSYVMNRMLADLIEDERNTPLRHTYNAIVRELS